MEGIRLRGRDRHREYNRLRMRTISKRERQKRKLSRFSSLIAKIREYEGAGVSDADIVKELATHFEFKLMKDKDKGIDR